MGLDSFETTARVVGIVIGLIFLGIALDVARSYLNFGLISPVSIYAIWGVVISATVLFDSLLLWRSRRRLEEVEERVLNKVHNEIRRVERLNDETDRLLEEAVETTQKEFKRLYASLRVYPPGNFDNGTLHLLEREQRAEALQEKINEIYGLLSDMEEEIEEEDGA